MAELTSEERRLCTFLGEIMHKGLTSRRLGQRFDLSEHTIRSLACTRRRPGRFVLERIERGCVQLLLDAKTPGARQVWWRLLDATVRCGLFPMRDATSRLRELLSEDLENAAAPEELLDMTPEVWNAFEAGGAPSGDLLEVVVKSYQREAERLLEKEGQWEEALACRGVALIAEHLGKSNENLEAAP